ncbi:MAG: GIY-YIG nuclease family protein [Candidatus Moraniibacteriota bacterium]
MLKYFEVCMYFVYILLSLKDKKFYIGITGNLQRRIKEHNQKKVKSTKGRQPLKLICYEVYSSKKIAEKRERFLKSSDGKKDIRKRFK